MAASTTHMEYRNSWSCYKGWKASDKCYIYTQQKGIVPLQRALTVMLTAVLIPFCDLWLPWLQTNWIDSGYERGLLWYWRLIAQCNPKSSCPVHLTTTIHWKPSKHLWGNHQLALWKHRSSLLQLWSAFVMSSHSCSDNHCLSSLSATRVTTRLKQVTNRYEYCS